MNVFLFWTYIATILIFIFVILIIFLAWRDFFPRRWLHFLIISFTATIGAIFVLLIAELLAPFNANFYINPYLYIMYFGLTGCSLFAIYLLVLEIHYKHIKLLLILGYIVFIALVLLLIISSILLLLFKFSNYPSIAYVAFECAFGLGIMAYVLLALGSLKHTSSDRLEQEVRSGLIVVVVFSFGIAFGLTLIALGLLYMDFSTALDTNISIFWLLWISLVAILFLIMVRKAVSFFT